MEVSDLLPATPGQHTAQRQNYGQLQQQQQQQQHPPLASLSCEMSLTPTMQQTQSSMASQLSPITPLTPTTPRTTTHTPREIPTMYILDDLYDDDYIDQFNSYNTTTPTEEPDPSVSVQLAPCPICSRTFNPVTLRKHVGICEKMTTKRRNVFDSSRQRREGTELASYPLPKNFGLPEKASSNNLARTKSERGQSPNPQQVSSPILQRKKPTEDFVRSTARTSMRKLSTSSANDIAPTNFNRDRMRSSERSLTRRVTQASPGEQCPHCDRCFGIKAFDRHVEWCKEKALQASIKHQASSKAEENIAKARLEARTKYKAPCLKTKRSVNRDKYSGLPGDENEDSPKPLKIGNKTHDINNLMSTSMTSSITSERKISQPTGNRINEPSNTTTDPSLPVKTSPTPATAIAPAATSDALSVRKRSRDSVTHTTVTPPPPPPLVQPKSDDQLSTETVANFEIEMPDLRWVGEQMTASGASKSTSKKSTKAARDDKKTINVAAPVAVAVAARKKTTTKTNQQQPQQQHVIPSRADHKLQADVTHSMKGHNVVAAAATSVPHKKTPSDLPLKTKRQIQFKDSHAAKSHQGADGGRDADDAPSGHGHGNECDHRFKQADDEEEEKAKERATTKRKVDLTKSLTFYASPSEEVNEKTTIQSHDDEPKKPSKMTMEEYFNEGSDSKEMDMVPIPKQSMKKSETFDTELIEETIVLGSKKIISSRKDVKRFATKPKILTHEVKNTESSDDMEFSQRSCQLRDVILIRCEGLIKASETQMRPKYSEDEDRMTMTQSYPRTSQSRNDPEADDSEDNDTATELGRKSYLDLQELKTSSKAVMAKSITKMSSKTEPPQKPNAQPHDPSKLDSREEVTRSQNKSKEQKPPSQAKSTKAKKIVEAHIEDPELLSYRSTELSDDASSVALKSNRGNLKARGLLRNKINKSRDSLETRKRYEVDDNNNNSDHELLNSAEETTTSSHDLSAVGESDDDDISLKAAVSNADTFIKTDSESEDVYTTPPETKEEDPESPVLSYDELQSLIPNFRSFSPRKKTVRTSISTTEDKTPQKTPRENTSPKQHKSNNDKVRTLTPRLPRCSTPPPAISGASGSLPNTPRSITSLRSQKIQAKLETSPIKSLNIYRPQRSKVMRQPASGSSNSGPMKAVPLTKESIEIYGISSSQHIISQEKQKEEDEDCNNDHYEAEKMDIDNDSEEEQEAYEDMVGKKENLSQNIAVDTQEIRVIKEPPKSKLERNNSFTVSGLPDNYDPFLSAKRQLEELCSPTDSPSTIARSTTPLLPSLPSTPAPSSKMSASFTLGSSTSQMSSPMTTSQTPQPTHPKTPTLARSTSFRRTGSLRGPRRSPLLTQRVPLFAQKHRPTIQRGLSDEGPISSNFLKPEEFDEMPVRSVCVNDYAVTKSPRVVRRDTSASNRKQPLKLNINAANSLGVGNGSGLTPDTAETESAPNTASRYVSKTDSLAVFLKYETELEKMNKSNLADSIKQSIDENANPSQNLDGDRTTTTTSIDPHVANLDGPLNTKELKDKSNNLSKQNSAKNIKAEFLEHETNENVEINVHNNNYCNNTPSTSNSNEMTPLNTKYNSVRLTPLSKPSTPLTAPTTQPTKPSTPVTKPSTPLTTKPSTPLTTKPSTPLTKPSTPLTTKPSTPLTTKPSTPLTKPTTPMTTKSNTTPLTPLRVKTPLLVPLEQTKIQKPVALSSLFHSDRNTEECKNALNSDYIDPKLINKCDNLPVNLNKLRGSVFKASDSDASDARVEHFSSSSSEFAAPALKFLPTVKTDANNSPKTASANQNLQPNMIPTPQPTAPPPPPPTSLTQPQIQSHTMPQQHSSSLSQRNSAEGRNLLKRRMRLGRNQFLYDASPEIDSSCSADDEANRSSLECERFIRDQEKAFERFSSSAQQQSPLDAPFIPPPPLPAEFEDFDFEEFLSSFENDEEQFPLFKDCREFLLNRTSKKQRSMLIPNSNANTQAQTKKNTLTNPQQQQHTFPTLTPSQQTPHFVTQSQPQSQSPSQQQQHQHFQFPHLPQHKGLFDSFSPHTNRSKNRTLDPYPTSLKSEEKREIFISIETEQNDLDKSPISPNSIRHMVGNPQCMVEVEVDAHSHDNKFSKISDDDEMAEQGTHSTCPASRFTSGGKQFCGLGHLPNVQLNNAKNLIQQMQEDFRHLGEEMSANIRQSMEHQRSLAGQGIGSDAMSSQHQQQRSKVHKATGTPSGDAYADSDELSSLDGYPLSSPNSRLGVSSKTSADSAYGSLSRQRSSELSQQRSNSSRHRPLTSSTAAGNVTMMSRPLTEERSRQLSASSSSSSEHALPPIGGNTNYQKQQQQQQQQQHLSQLYSTGSNNMGNISNNNNNINNNPNDMLDDMLLYERNNNFDTPIHPSINNGASPPTTMLTSNTPHHSASGAAGSNHESTTPMSSNNQLYGSNSTMSTSMKMSKFCHECGSRFVLEQAKFCMDCGVKRIVL